MLKPDLDIELHEDVVDELAFDPSVDERAIAVAVSGHVVTLRGFVKSYSQKLAAEQAVKRVRGVHGLVEELTIELPVEHVRNDVDVVAAAIEALRWNASVPNDSVFVRAEHGWVTLTGNLEWQYQREAARLAVVSLAGIVGVTNDITLLRRDSIGDLKARIHEAFRRSAAIDAGRIEVEMSNGTVVLRGTVHSWSERDAAATAAFSIPGIWDVQNLTVVSSATASDAPAATRPAGVN
jgi:osmotically-inducible protein OsmY